MRTGFASALLLAGWAFAPIVVAADTTPPQAVNEARTMPRPDPRAITSAGRAGATVPQYGADPSSMSNLFNGGNGDLIGPGSTRAAACNSLTDSECQAVQLIQNGRFTRPTFTINPADPLISGADNTRRNPSPIIGPNPGGITFPSTQCTTNTTTTPATFSDETCDIATPTNEQVCEVVRDILVDRDANYRCDTVGNKVQSYVCDKILGVTVTWIDNCQVPTATRLQTDNGTMLISTRCAPDLQGYLRLDVSPSYQCRGGSCNSDYYPIDVRLQVGVPTSGTVQMGGNYTCGGRPCYITMAYTYDGAGRVRITEQGDSSFRGAPTYLGSGYLLSGSCPSGSSYTSKIQGGYGEGAGCYTGNMTCPAGFSLVPLFDLGGNFIGEECYSPASPPFAIDIDVTGGFYRTPSVSEAWINNCASLEARQ